MQSNGSLPIRDLLETGSSYVARLAGAAGYRPGGDWINLGQGEPEITPIADGLERLAHVAVDANDARYSPMGGRPELRQAIADHYNRLFRAGRQPYTAANVAVAPGGRGALTRVLAALRAGPVLCPVPEYMGYWPAIDAFARLSLRPVHTGPEDGFLLGAAALRSAAADASPSAVLISNPCNPTGRTLEGAALQVALEFVRARRSLLIVDEFYSQYVYVAQLKERAAGLSAAAIVEDVNHDPVVLIDGLTKAFRYPGLRLGWLVGPPAVVEAAIVLAAALDGGTNTLAQGAALRLLRDPALDYEFQRLREGFAAKARFLRDGLERVGVRFPFAPGGGFYLWGHVGDAKWGPTADEFVRRAIEARVLTIPGRFFTDEPQRDSPWVRFSFGGSHAELAEAVRRFGADPPR